VDSGGGLHLVASDAGCVWYVARSEGLWGIPECISALVAARAFIETPSLAIGQGNQLHVMFYTDRRQMWYTTKQLALAGETPEQIPVEPTATSVPPTVTTAPLPTRTPLPEFGQPPQPGAITTVGYAAILAGLFPVALVFAALLFVRRRRKP
jgi:hypothetical protein